MPKPYEPTDARAYSVAEVAKLMGTNRGYVYSLINSGRLRHIKLGSIKVPHEFLVEFYRAAEGTDLSNPLEPKPEEVNCYGKRENPLTAAAR